ncbi:Kiwa anti-phage protein KwaB-like domain-containing protein [Brenneria uluponensis]|uniref:Kiwa anti-phage protein KwaB-like domain-containing protein n=1 Tax=Brenneria uluponensis TaxID=3057057 RepID=UPI0028E38D10|nr:Kiwa anti-phage protein KwaB-like domain-containing protein [Brenneria ulupoensis]
MPLFALMDDQSATKILRIQLDRAANALVSRIFSDQKTRFETHHMTKVSFFAGYTPSCSECFELDNFNDSTLLIDAVTRNTAIPVWDPNIIGIDHIKALFVGVSAPTNNNIIAIQTFTKKQILDTSKSFVMQLLGNANTFSQAANVGFNIDDKLVAIIDGNKIFFKSFFKLRSIFDMTPYFQEATDDQLDDFANHASFYLPAGFDIKNIADTPIRSKVTLVNNSGILNSQNLVILKSAAQKINFPLQTQITGTIEKIIMPSTKKEIKALLDFLDEDIFTSDLSQQVFKSNSKRPYV